MEIHKLAGKNYCIVEKGFIYERLEKILSEAFHLRKDSFAEAYSKRIFRSFFQSAKDMRKEYIDFYKQEYDSFNEYLYKKELLDWAHIKILNLGEQQTLLKLNTELTNYNIDNLIDYDEENCMKIINDIFKEIEI